MTILQAKRISLRLHGAAAKIGFPTRWHVVYDTMIVDKERLITGLVVTRKRPRQ